MSQYELDLGSEESAAKFAALDEFTQGFIEALFWLGDHGDDGADDTPRPDIAQMSLDDLAPKTWSRIIEECADFQSLDAWQAWEANDACDAHQGGVDFLLTRNRHGAGFWDRGLPNPHGKALTEWSHTFSSDFDLYAGDDGKLYVF